MYNSYAMCIMYRAEGGGTFLFEHAIDLDLTLLDATATRYPVVQYNMIVWFNGSITQQHLLSF